jgi:hypothetical protein
MVVRVDGWTLRGEGSGKRVEGRGFRVQNSGIQSCSERAKNEFEGKKLKP